MITLSTNTIICHLYFHVKERELVTNLRIELAQLKSDDTAMVRLSHQLWMYSKLQAGILKRYGSIRSLIPVDNFAFVM